MNRAGVVLPKCRVQRIDQVLRRLLPGNRFGRGALRPRGGGDQQGGQGRDSRLASVLVYAWMSCRSSVSSEAPCRR